MSHLNSVAPTGIDPGVAAARLRKLCSLRPTLAVVLGSGFGDTFPGMRVALEMPYAKLPGFPRTTVAGHAGVLRVGCIGAASLVTLSGRAHYYEGHSMDLVTFPIRVLAELGVQDLLLTNAAGGINKRFRPGEFMLMTDHINFMGENPLRGEVPADKERFVDLTQVYDPKLNAMLKQCAKKAKLRLQEGVYLALSGPSYETPAEIRVFAQWGADVVGMSTVPEAMVARQYGLAVAGISCITNLAAGRSPKGLSHAEVLSMGRQMRTSATRLLKDFCELYATHR